MRPSVQAALLPALILLAGCARETPCPRCDTIVIAATGEPASILPPLAVETVARDIGDQVYEHLALLESGRAPVDTGAYRPGLAARWERADSTTWRFHLRPGARWSDGQPVTAGDVVFSFDAFSDATIDAPARSYLAGVIDATAENDSTVLLHFVHPSAEELYDATYHVRVIPRHIWEPIPRKDWAQDTSVAHLVGSGPYKVTHWDRGASLVLVAVPSSPVHAGIRRVIWRFVADPDAALNLVASHEADVLETVGSPERVARLQADTTLAGVPYPSAVYGFLGFNLTAPGCRATSCGAHPVLGDRLIRRALVQAVDRQAAATSTFGPGSKAPPGPMSQVQWIWSDSIVVLPYDTARSGSSLDALGWRRGSGGVRSRGGKPLALDILVPGTSLTRRRLAETVQEAWRRLGVAVTITTVDFPVFQQRIEKGAFDTYVGSWLDEPSPRSLADQWTRSGWQAINYGRYFNPRFDSLLDQAGRLTDVSRARATWREAMDTLNADAAAIFLYAPVNVAAVSKRLQNVRIDPFSWLSRLPSWTIDPARSEGR